MKKTKILVPALAVLALGVAASVSGTFAWFTVTANTAAKSLNDATHTITSAIYNAGQVTFKVTCTFDSPSGLDLTNDYGLNYYINGDENTLDVSKTNLSGTDLKPGSDYVKLTVALSASVAEGSISNALNAYGAADDVLSVDFSASGTGSTYIKYSGVNAAVPTQATISTTQESGYVTCGATSTGATYYRSNTATWAGVAKSANKYSLLGSYSNSAEQTLSLGSWVYYVGLKGEDDVNQDELLGKVLTFTPTLISNDESVVKFGN